MDRSAQAFLTGGQATLNLMSVRIWYKESKLILGIDIGTTYSGATFVLLQQGND